jgi:tRNA pseudouridine38-40 synthase
MRIALGIEYDGAKYCGWQRQVDVDSVQERLEKALSHIANKPIAVFCAGRTDTGVHGTGQVVHFDVDIDRKMATLYVRLFFNTVLAIIMVILMKKKCIKQHSI